MLLFKTIINWSLTSTYVNEQISRSLFLETLNKIACVIDFVVPLMRIVIINSRCSLIVRLLSFITAWIPLIFAAIAKSINNPIIRLISYGSWLILITFLTYFPLTDRKKQLSVVYFHQYSMIFYIDQKLIKNKWVMWVQGRTTYVLLLMFLDSLHPLILRIILHSSNSKNEMNTIWSTLNTI